MQTLRRSFNTKDGEAGLGTTHRPWSAMPLVLALLPIEKVPKDFQILQCAFLQKKKNYLVLSKVNIQARDALGIF